MSNYNFENVYVALLLPITIPLVQQLSRSTCLNYDRITLSVCLHPSYFTDHDRLNLLSSAHSLAFPFTRSLSHNNSTSVNVHVCKYQSNIYPLCASFELRKKVNLKSNRIGRIDWSSIKHRTKKGAQFPRC